MQCEDDPLGRGQGIPQSSHFFDLPVCARQLIAPSGCSSGGPTITEVARGPGSLLKRMRKRSHPACSISLPISDERDLAVNPKQCKPRQRRTCVDIEELRQWVRGRLRSTRVPALIDVRTELPYNETGKLLRRVLKAEAVPGASG